MRKEKLTMSVLAMLTGVAVLAGCAAPAAAVDKGSPAAASGAVDLQDDTAGQESAASGSSLQEDASAEAAALPTVQVDVDINDPEIQKLMQGADLESLTKGHTKGGHAVHDPSIIRAADGTYWIFGTHESVARSDDMVYWKKVYDGERKTNKLFSNLYDDPTSEDSAFGWVGKNAEGGYSVWAPDVIYNEKMGKYCMYFCTSSTYVKSSLCLATSDTIEGPYEFQTRLIDSGFKRLEAKQGKGGLKIMDYCADATEMQNRYLTLTDYNNQKWPNAIDPTVFYDTEGKLWMVYGSWSGGIFILELDEETGLVKHPERDDEAGVDSYFGKRLLGGGHQSIEGPYIMYDPVSQYYYLFVSYGGLQHDGGYQVRLYRSKNPDGPYEDTMGQKPGSSDHQKYGLKMTGNYTFPSLDVTYMAPGHNSAFIDDDGKMYLVYHQRFANKGETFEPRVHQMWANEDGWLVAAPFETSGETISAAGYDPKDLIGIYYYVNHQTDISSEVHNYQMISLDPSGVVNKLADDQSVEKAYGSWSAVSGTPYVNITIGSTTFKGVMISMKDEAGNDTMCFTAAGDNNQTIWGVHYLAGNGATE